jgi:hypothetical protein
MVNQSIVSALLMRISFCGWEEGKAIGWIKLRMAASIGGVYSYAA